jgi:hypothetical protein
LQPCQRGGTWKEKLQVVEGDIKIIHRLKMIPFFSLECDIIWGTLSNSGRIKMEILLVCGKYQNYFDIQ